MAVAIRPFSFSKQAKKEYLSWRNEAQAEANRMGIAGYVLSQAEYEVSPGHSIGDVFVPKVKPVRPPNGATKSAWRTHDLDLAEYNAESAALTQYTSVFVKSLDAAHLKVVGDRNTGTNNRTLLQMFTALNAKYNTWQENEIIALKASLTDGTVSIKIDEPFDIYLTEVKEIFEISKANYCAIPEAEKIAIVYNELKKLDSEEINARILAYKTTHSAMKDKDFAAFATVAEEAFNTADRTTMKKAGYSAAMQQQQQQKISELEQQIKQMQQQLMVNNNQRQQPEGENKKRGRQQKGEATKDSRINNKDAPKYCDTCKHNKSHWSNTCRTPKTGHDDNKMAP